jgi:hypothetical protein
VLAGRTTRLLIERLLEVELRRAREFRSSGVNISDIEFL